MTDTPDETNTAEDPAQTEDSPVGADLPTSDSDQADAPDEPDTFPRAVVEDLRKENGKYRQRAQKADTLAQRLHLELVKATGRLADPSDLEFSEEHLDDPDALAAAIDDLLDRKPHLATRRPSGDIGQGHRGPSTSGFSLLDMLKERT